MHRADSRFPLLALLVLAALRCSHEPEAAEPEALENESAGHEASAHDAPGAEHPTAAVPGHPAPERPAVREKPLRKRPALPAFYDAADMVGLRKLAEGETVLAYRRSPATGVIEVALERALDADSAAARLAALGAAGYEPWPPPPAPELAPLGDPNLAECPFLVSAAVMGDPFATEASMRVVCARTPEELEARVTSTLAVELARARALPIQRRVFWM